MNRLIEFRVWDTLIRKMMSDQPYIAFENKEYIFMQFTGLYDFKGTKIFEGDIVEMTGSGSKYTIQYNTYKASFMIDGRFRFNIDIHSKDLKVIGNIFEPP